MNLLLKRLLNRRRAERVSQDRTADRYRCVLVFQYAGKPLIQGNAVTSKQRAMQQWKHFIASGQYAIGSGRRALVMTDADYRHMAGGAA